jgi:tetratricopeptide (TPR) repeat protein
MTAIQEIDDDVRPSATDGEIAAINLEGARRRAWMRFLEDPRRPGVTEEIVEHERVAGEFLGDLAALDRLEALAAHFALLDASSRVALVQADAASTLHRFDDARGHLARAALLEGPSEPIERALLTIDQACGMDLEAVLATRQRIAMSSGRPDDLVPLGAVLADLERFAEADAVYRQAFYSFDAIAPWPLAYLCFQLGMLWGELVPVPDPGVAALWYRRAIGYVPGYVRAHVHLAEIYAGRGQAGAAETLLRPALSSGDPEVPWRLADALTAQHRFEEAETLLEVARSGFERLLGRHLLAFADHAAEFYAGSGDDCRRALDLARANVANRPTRRAVKQMHTIEAKCQ